MPEAYFLFKESKMKSYFVFSHLTDPAPTPKNDDPQKQKSTWKDQIAKKWKKIQPSSSNMQPPSYPEGGSIGNYLHLIMFAFIDKDNKYIHVMLGSI